MTYHCFFEQSGTFKNEFRKLGYEAFDYDIRNDFGETDYKCDLFEEIRWAYFGHGSIFDRIALERDTIIAFFPCVRFSCQSNFLIRAAASQYIKKSEAERIEVSMNFERERTMFYGLFCKLCIVCLRKKIPLIIENPYSSESYLVRYFPFQPAVVDLNRRERGDAYEKPTMFFFFNREPSNNFIFEAVAYHKWLKVEKQSTVKRSMITPDYANRFIREFIL